MSRLRVHFATFGNEWDEIIAALGKEGWVRVESAVVNKLVDLGLRARDERRHRNALGGCAIGACASATNLAK